MEKFVPRFSEFYESLSAQQLNRNNRVKIDLSQVKVAYHWLTEGKLFDACYSGLNDPNGGQAWLLKRGKMPPLPEAKYLLGSDDGLSVCLTVDPAYMDPAFNEDGSCIVFDFKKLTGDLRITEDLTDNGEAEFRIQTIPDWPKYALHIDVNKQSYLKGLGWEGFRFRALNEWLPEELKPKVNMFTSHAALLRDRKKPSAGDI